MARGPCLKQLHYLPTPQQSSELSSQIQELQQLYQTSTLMQEQLQQDEGRLQEERRRLQEDLQLYQEEMQLLQSLTPCLSFDSSRSYGKSYASSIACSLSSSYCSDDEDYCQDKETLGVGTGQGCPHSAALDNENSPLCLLSAPPRGGGG